MKSKFLKYAALVALLLGMSTLTACEDKEPDPGEGGGGASGFTIEQKHLNHTLDKSEQTIEIPVQTNIANSQWYVNTDVPWLFVSKKGPSEGVGTVTVKVDENNTGQTRTGFVTISSTTVDYKVTIKQFATSDLIVEEDISVKPTGATATNHQPGSEISLSYDDNPDTYFHSRWEPAGPFPFEIKYTFAGQEEINYIEYVPRKDGGNGTFKEFEVYVAEDPARSDFEKIGVYNNASPKTLKIALPDGGKRPTAVKFVINSGIGNVVSCAEMRFKRYNTETELNRKLLEVFTDLTCSELKPGVTLEQIQTLDPAFQQVGEALLNGTYDSFEKSFRVHEYKAYSDPTAWSGPLMTKVYSNWDNPMGISAKRGEKMLILVGETHGNNLQVQIVAEEGTVAGKNRRPQSQGEFHSLRPGVNQITPGRDGQLFLMYNAVPSAETSKPVKVHVPLGSGQFVGYWRLDEHKTNDMYKQILEKTSSAREKYFCVVGERMLFYFNRDLLPREDIVDAITQWDNIITWQQNFMGIEDVRPALWNNHIAGISMEEGCGYMWASDWCMGFVEEKINDIMGEKNLTANADNAWGPAHEMGHINQLAINWASTTESSNNLFSNYVLHKYGKYNSRGTGLYYRFGAVYERDQSWASMNYKAGQDGPEIPVTYDDKGNRAYNEDTEIHMRMNWQLWNYYHRVLGDDKFFGRVFKYMRELGLGEGDDCGRKMLEYAVACSKAANNDLTDFFEAWGFFKPLNSTVSQYGDYRYRVTADMINDAKNRMAQFSKPKHALEYIEDRKGRPAPGDPEFDMIGDLGYYTTYQSNLKVSSSASATVSGRNVTTANCDNAVAIEIRVKDGNNYGSIRYASNFTAFTIPAKIQTGGCAVYAVQADGTRIHLADL